jgi:biopolymer transport protein ExbB
MSVFRLDRRLNLWLLLSLLVLTVSYRVPAFAQEKGEDAAAEKAAPEETTESTEAAPAAEKTEAPKSQNTLWWIIHTSGWIGAVLLVISVYFLAVVVQMFLELREQVLVPPGLVEECNSLLAKRDFNGIYKTAKENGSETGELIAAGMAAMQGGLSDAREAIDRTGEVLTVEMEKKISMLAVIGSLGPMIGLLGTLKGMIASFGAIATGGTQLKAQEVAGGISEALLITFEGVALSVPAIYFFAVFKNRVASLSLKAINTADDFIRKLHTVAHSKPTSTPSANA